MAKKKSLIFLLPLLLMVLPGCRTLSFYTQAVKGQYEIVANQKPVEKLIAAPQTSARLKNQLALVQELRAFAKTELRLPVDGHYQRYADLRRPYVVWNVGAAREFSLEPKGWWYPFVGSLEYRGYFAERAARDYAASLEKKGFDVYVGGVEAYSTLGWFKDPLLNTFLFHEEPALAEILFHELGHQRVFASGDTEFNEAFATTVGQEGTRRWLRSKGDTNAFEKYSRSLLRNDEYVHLIMKAREQLMKIYGDERDKDGRISASKMPLSVSPEELRRKKERVFVDLRSDYQKLKAEWGGYSGYDKWFAGDLNNARLNSVATYYDFVPAFEHLLKLNGDDPEKFYQAVELLAKKPKEERHQALTELQNASRQGTSK